MKRVFAGVLALAALSASAGYACTPDELQAKIAAVSEKLQEVSQRDPQRADELKKKFAAQQQGTAEPKTIDDLCKLYDDMLAEMN